MEVADNEDLIPKLKSSPVPILFIPFNNKENECNYCGNKYSRSLLFEQKYCKECLFIFIEDATDDHATCLDVNKNNTRYIGHEADICTGNIKEWCKNCTKILYIKQIVLPLLFSKYKKAIRNPIEKYESGKSGDHSKTSDVDFLISSGRVESLLTRESILILYLPWWDSGDKCIVCEKILNFIPNCQKSCSHCYTTYIGCRYCLTTNIIFGITDRSQCKNCKKIYTINVINIPNLGSGNYYIDEFLYYTRFNTNNYHAITNYINYYKNKRQARLYNFIKKELVNNTQPIMEWIPYSQIRNFKKIARGGFGVVYKATLFENNKDVAVKRFFSQDIKKILNELKSLFQCYDKYFIIKYYGITQDPKSKDYMLVMEYANGKNLYKYLRENFTNITWYKKINILWKISEGLRVIHEKNFIHRDFHSGNIFLSESDSYQHWQIGDLGLTRHANDTFLNGELYGIISYTAPEILKCEKYSKESDIYSIGMIMWELTTGCKPFDNLKNDITESELMLSIIDGERPEITKDTPECFSNLMKRCWDSNPTKRPSAKEIYGIYYFWLFRGKHVEQFNEAEEMRLKLLKLKELGPEFIKIPYSSPKYTKFSITLLNTRSKIKNSNNNGRLSKDIDFDIQSCLVNKNTTDTTSSKSLAPHTYNGDPTPKLKSSPIPILFIPFNNKENNCSYCGNEYFETILFAQKYCKNCLIDYIKEMGNINLYLDLRINGNNTQCISEILHFKQIVYSPLSPKYIEEKVEENCKLCGNLIYQSMNDINCIFCSDCYLIFCEWIDSTLTKKPIPILCLPWWDVSYDCMTCGKHLDIMSDHQKWCSNCLIIYNGCRYCLTTNIIFGITDKSRCKKCNKIVFITTDIANTTSGNYDIDVLLGLDTNNYHMIASYNKYINNNEKRLNSLQIYEFISDKFGNEYNSIIKWFPYSQTFKTVEEIAKGGFSIIYKANVAEYGIVILKKFEMSQNVTKPFLDELKSNIQCYSRFDFIAKLYGITQDPLLGDYMLVMEYADGGNLHDYLRKNFANITWKEKLIILQNISEGLHSIHKENIIHRDIHSGNILLKKNDSGNLWKIGDLGLSQPENNILNKDKIYGVIPYIAPEIFKGSSFSKASDIYSLGMIMWELTTGCKPFENVNHYFHIILKVLNGERPKITEDTTEFFANLMKRCWNLDPFKRPIIFEILEFISRCNYSHITKFVELKQAEEKRIELIRLKKIALEFSEKTNPRSIYISRALNISPLSAFISKCSSINSSEIDFDYIDYISEELNLDIYTEPQNHDYNSHNIEVLNIETQNNGKRTKVDDIKS
ncbi:hypothetical protein RclHR1_19340003 [Rhizophagus clarus]|uniref:Protein kinase domain-containing protein n=1 Tax=Rhizophagus clarus TaxID=94130 RepID=A0A2Z6R2N9_9GLOM|nr:hypothetical protein RclHR1_19340003 [Rhizophagus clarus]